MTGEFSNGVAVVVVKAGPLKWAPTLVGVATHFLNRNFSRPRRVNKYNILYNQSDPPDESEGGV